MTEKGLTRRDFEELFTGFEKRKDEKLMGLEDRVDEKFKGLDERLNGLEDRVVNQFHVIAEGLIDHIKLLAEGHTGIINRLDRTEKENERQHLETRALVKLSFAELDRRFSDLESQMLQMQEWKKKVEARLQT